MTETLSRLLLRLSEAEHPVLWGRVAAPHFGRDFERMLAQRVLVEEAPTETWGLCSNCDCGLDARPIQRINGRPVAVCPLDHQADTHLTDTDIRSFLIDTAVLVRLIATASFGVEPSQIASGVWHLGPTATKRATFIAPSRSAVLQPGLVGTLRLFDRSSQTTLIAPPIPAAEQTRFAEAGILLVSSRECLACHDGAAAFAIDTAKLELPSAFAPRLVICRSGKSVVLDGIPKPLSDQTFKLLVLLAEQAMKTPAVIEKRHIENHLWGASVHRITSEVREPVRALRDALAAGGTDPNAVRSLIQNRQNPNGYRLMLAPEDIQLSP
ncbi:MAG: response regulator transcription factor [Alphaproteobacteria bacterium]|nr:response regulator transcription factor [Alphaproteobacteria bacterium]